MLYNVSTDLKLIRELAGATREQLASEIGIDPVSVMRIENGETYPESETLNKIYDFAVSKKIKLTYIKEMFYKEEAAEGHLILFHGSKEGIEGPIDISKTKETNDFGKGFYCGESSEQSLSFVSRFDRSSLYIIDFDSEGLKPIRYNVDLNWMLKIAFHRGMLVKYADHPVVSALSKETDGYDYIIAPIADNRMFDIIDRFVHGEITEEQCAHCLAATNLGYQYVFVSNKSAARLRIIERCFIPAKERKIINSLKSEDLKLGEDKVNAAMIKYRGKGRYIEEILA